MKIIVHFAAAAVLLIAALHAPAAELRVGAADTVESVLNAQKDQRVSLRLRSGQEITGVVRMVNAQVLHLGTLTSREYFDAVLPLAAIDAVLVRTRE